MTCQPVSAGRKVPAPHRRSSSASRRRRVFDADVPIQPLPQPPPAFDERLLRQLTHLTRRELLAGKLPVGGAYVNTYAGLASAMVALVFLYWTASIFIYGGELNAAILRMRSRRAAPMDNT